MKLSIAIPTCESKGRGVEFLEDLFRTIEIQTFKDFEVVVSDHSKDDKLIDVVDQFQHKFNITYFKNKNDFGNGPANTNKAIDHCEGEIVKIMFQDDFFYDDEALEKIYNSLHESDKDWLVCGCNHTRTDGEEFYWTLMPKWNNDLLRGVNSISSPSVMAFKNDKVKERFDESVVMMMDCEMYYRLNQVHGQPVYLYDDLVTNRVHDGQISMQKYKSKDFAEFMEKEVRYCIEKHSE